MDRQAGLQAIWDQSLGVLQPLGQITGTGGSAVDNSTTSSPFIIPLGARLVLQCVVASTAVAFIATPDVDSGATLTPTTTGAYPQIALGQFIEQTLWGGGGQGNPGQGTKPGGSAIPTISVISANAFTVNVFRTR